MESEIEYVLTEENIFNSTKAELLYICKKFAEVNHHKFKDFYERSTEEKIEHIANGRYIQYLFFKKLKNKDYDVSLDLSEGDDKGVDGIIKLDSHALNIDVKSTRGSMLKIALRRDLTDFYAVCQFKDGKVSFFGFIFKEAFWSSKIIKTNKPQFYNGMYVKSLDEIKNIS